MAKDDFLQDLTEELQATKPRSTHRGKKVIGSTLKQDARKSRVEVERAKGTTLIKGRKRKTIFLPPELVDEIDATAKSEGVQLMDFYHWLINEGWKAYLEGRVEPEVTEITRVVRGLRIDGYNDAS